MPVDSTIPLLLFAKEPVPGQVKTRMQECLTPALCARLARQMLEDSLGNACRYWPGEVLLCVSPHSHSPYFSALAARSGVAGVSQSGGDLGARMFDALRRHASIRGAVVMGCDVPYLDGDELVRAHELMTAGKSVIGPAADGGFYLLGLQRAYHDLFTAIRWGSDTVFNDFAARCAARDLELTLLATHRDIDNCEDLEWLAGFDERYMAYID